MRQRLRMLAGSSGQSLVEFAIMLPLVLLIVLGVVEVGFALLDQQVVTRLTREGSNLISRDTSLADAATAMQTITSRPVNFANGSKMIFSVLQEGRDDRDAQLQPDHPVSALRVRELHGHRAS